MTQHVADQLVTIAVAKTEFEAQLLVAVLADAGYDAFASGFASNVLPLDLKCFNVPVQVRSEDAAAAKAVLAENRAQSPSIDWASVDIGAMEDDLPYRAARRGVLFKLAIILGVIAVAVAVKLLMNAFA
jgi:hypothetical protein